MQFHAGEYDDAQLLLRMMIKDAFKTTLHSKTTTHSVVELYAATKHEVLSVISSSRTAGVPSFTLADFWTAVAQGQKYISAHAYIVDSPWALRSILLVTRAFTLSYAERSDGIRGPFKR